MESHSWHRVHVWFGNVLDDYGDVEIPRADRLIVRSGHKAPIFVNECDSIDRSKMLIVFLRDFARVDVVLCTVSVLGGKKSEVTHLDDLLV